MNLIKKDCGKHYGHVGGPCSKCKLFADYRATHRDALQYNGTPFIAVLETPQQAEERRRDEQLARYRMGIF